MMKVDENGNTSCSYRDCHIDGAMTAKRILYKIGVLEQRFKCIYLYLYTNDR